jgi:predicted metal-dependent hydrolase|tara:strand:- start:70 stop:438 length:369 start_codon:yes stop_codon:yes gene_type:complete
VNKSDKMSELFKRGLDEYDKGDYFEAHEAWEDLWSDYNFPDRKFVQGLIQLSVSFVHLGNGNLTGAKNLLKKCQQKFDDYNGIHREINLSDLKSSIEAVEIVYSELNDCRDFDWDLVPALKS